MRHKGKVLGPEKGKEKNNNGIDKWSKIREREMLEENDNISTWI